MTEELMSQHDPDAVPSKRADQLGFRPKRFWKASSVEAEGDAFTIRLDGRSVKTPGGAVLIVPTRVLAGRIQAEWDAVESHVNFEDMPLTRLAFTAIDRMGATLTETVAEALRYAETDLLAYPSDYPEALIRREAEAWRPVLAWAAGEGMSFEQNTSLIHKPQPAATLARLEELIRGMSIYERAGLMSAVPLFGSIVLAVALWKGRLIGEDAFTASRVGEDFQAETWGRDAEASQRAESMKKQSFNLQLWFDALRA